MTLIISPGILAVGILQNMLATSIMQLASIMVKRMAMNGVICSMTGFSTRHGERSLQCVFCANRAEVLGPGVHIQRVIIRLPVDSLQGGLSLATRSSSILEET